MDVRLGVISGAVFGGVLLAGIVAARFDAVPALGQGAIGSTVKDVLHLDGDEDDDREHGTLDAEEASGTGGVLTSEGSSADDRYEDDEYDDEHERDDDEHERKEHEREEHEDDDEYEGHGSYEGERETRTLDLQLGDTLLTVDLGF